jgi:indole-3-glycerol phosphate synthase
MTTADLLETIVAATRKSVEFRREQHPERELERITYRQPQGSRFIAALQQSPEPRVIAECKRRSPSRGILRADYDAVAHAKAYAKAGAAAISVLTEPTFFDGSLEHLIRVRAAVDLPVLRKDFIVTEYQLLEAAIHGADAVLLIVAALDDVSLKRFLWTCDELGLAPLVEVHDVAEAQRAQDADATVIGVNSRNLRTLAVDPDIHARVARVLPSDITAVAESGIRTYADLVSLSGSGYHAFLVGEQLIAQRDPGAALQELRCG